MRLYILSFLALTFSCKPMVNSEKKIPNFSFTTLDNHTIDTDSILGQATIMCVWATWCGDCIREIPELNDLVSKYENNPKVNFIALSDEDESTVRKSLIRFPFKFEHIVNAKLYTDQLKTGLIKHFPQVIVVDNELNVVFEVTENKSKIFKTLDTHIQQILDK